MVVVTQRVYVPRQLTDVATAAQQLPLPLLLREGLATVPRHDGQPAGQDAISHFPHKRLHIAARLRSGHVIKEQAANATVLFAGRDVEVPEGIGGAWPGLEHTVETALRAHAVKEADAQYRCHVGCWLEHTIPAEHRRTHLSHHSLSSVYRPGLYLPHTSFLQRRSRRVPIHFSAQ